LAWKADRCGALAIHASLIKIAANAIAADCEPAERVAASLADAAEAVLTDRRRFATDFAAA